MRKLITSLLLLLTYATIAQVGIGTETVDDSAILEVSSSNQGILLPQVPLISTTDALTIAIPEIGLLVYNTNTQNDIYPGYYYWHGSSWVPFMTSEYEEPSIKCRNLQETDINDNIDAPLFDVTVWNDDTTLYQVFGNKIIVNNAGDYRVQVSIHFVNPSQMVSPNAQLKVNGTTTGVIAASGAQETVGFGNPGGSLVINEVLSLSAFDDVAVRMSRGSSNTQDKEVELINGMGSSYIIITKIN